MKMAFSKPNAWLAVWLSLCIFLPGLNPGLFAQSTDPTTCYRKFVPSSFHLPADQTLILQEDLFLYCKGDVIIDGKIRGQKIENSNADGQNLSIRAEGDIIINGNIWLSDGGDGQMVPLASKPYAPLLISNVLSSRLYTGKTIKLETCDGGKGGSLVLEGRRIIIRGEIRVGNGGAGIAGGNGGNGGHFFLRANQLTSRQPLNAGNGSKGGDGTITLHANGGNGGDGGRIDLFACTNGSNGMNGANGGNGTAGGDGTADNDGIACNGGNGGDGGNGTVSVGGGNGGIGGNGGQATNTVAGGSALGGHGGNGGKGGSSTLISLGGGNGGNGGNGGAGIGANGAMGGTCTAANGGAGTGGAGGNGGNGGSSTVIGVAGGAGGNAGNGGNGTGGNAGTCIAVSCSTPSGGIGTGGAAGAIGIGGTGLIGILNGANGTAGSPGSSTNGTNGTCTLPIELLHFQASKNATQVHLKWSTATETNNDYMAVERSADGVHFIEIGRRKGQGTTAETQYYTLVDEHPLQGNNYYRLRQVDFDQTTDHSKVIALHFERGQVLSLFPNPARDKVFLQTPLNLSAGQVYLLDALGKKFAPVLEGAMGWYELTLPNHLPKGHYWVIIQHEKEVLQTLLIKE